MTPTVNGELVNRVQQLRLDGQLGAGPGRRGGGSWLPWLLCGLLALSWAGVGVRWYRSAGTPRPAEAGEGGAKQLSAVAAAPTAAGPAAAPGEILLQLKGNLIPFLQIAVSPRDVAGELTGITFYEGMPVKQNDLLATILDTQYRNRVQTDKAAVASAEAQREKAKAGEAAATVRVAKAEAALASAKARVTKCAANLDRASKDFEQAVQQKARGAISAQEYQKFDADKQAADADKVASDADVVAAAKEIDATKAEVNTAAASVKAAGAEVEAAKARLAESDRLLDNCKITAPIDGTVLTKKADRGSLVSPAAFNVSASLCEIADLSKLEVEVDVPERQIRKVQPKQECQIAADADPNRVYRGEVHRVMPIADDSKNVIKVRIRVYLPAQEKAGEFLRPKMSVTATIINREFADRPDERTWK